MRWARTSGQLRETFYVDNTKKTGLTMLLNIAEISSKITTVRSGRGKVEEGVNEPKFY